jgi:hypothetical protein
MRSLAPILALLADPACAALVLYPAPGMPPPEVVCSVMIGAGDTLAARVVPGWPTDPTADATEQQVDEFDAAQAAGDPDALEAGRVYDAAGERGCFD